ncbi:MAG: DNA alkylation repair protein [Flavobacteriia bacterium]|nr:DNA alkylation repair protein [Flavobacteriia bacterium]
MYQLLLLEKELNSYQKIEKAISMKKYMKNKFEFYGISSPKRKEIQQKYFQVWKQKTNALNKFELIFLLWDLEYREYQYIAIDWMKKWKKTLWIEEDIDCLSHLISHKSWWDSVDLLASNCLSNYFLQYPNKVEYICDNWSNSNNLWLERSTLIFQLKFKEKTNFDLLSKYIFILKDKKDFFIQKAIGWSLREYAKTNRDIVFEFINKNNIVGLAKREALKNQILF